MQIMHGLILSDLVLGRPIGSNQDLVQFFEGSVCSRFGFDEWTLKNHPFFAILYSKVRGSVFSGSTQP